MRVNWTNEKDRILFEHYPVTSTKELSELLGASLGAIYRRANTLGLKKCNSFLSSSASGRIARDEQRSPETRFKKGNVPWSAGKKDNAVQCMQKAIWYMSKAVEVLRR